MIAPDTAKPATVFGEPALNVEQLGGRLNQNNSETLPEIQVRSLRRRLAVGYSLAASLAPLIWGAGPR